MLSKSAALSSSPPSPFSFRLGFFLNWLLLAVQTSPERPPDPPSVVKRSRSQLSAPACLLWMLFTHRGFDDEQRAALSALLGGSRVGFHTETKTNETKIQTSPRAGALFTRRTRLACSRPQNSIQLLSPAGRECVGINRLFHFLSESLEILL